MQVVRPMSGKVSKISPMLQGHEILMQLIESIKREHGMKHTQVSHSVEMEIMYDFMEF